MPIHPPLLTHQLRLTTCNVIPVKCGGYSHCVRAALNPRELTAHKQARKTLRGTPLFRPMAKGKWPRPFNRMARPRTQATDLIRVSDDHGVMFVWRDGEDIEDRAFYGHLLELLPNGALYPLMEFHCHPKHKGLHLKLPCRTVNDYRNRLLPGAPELNLKSSRQFDPSEANDRAALIVLFCKLAGIAIYTEHPDQADLFC
jgi:hypothetical protein